MGRWKTSPIPLVLLIAYFTAIPDCRAETSFVLKDTKDSFLRYKLDAQVNAARTLHVRFRTKSSDATLLEIRHFKADNDQTPSWTHTIKIATGSLEFSRQVESHTDVVKDASRVDDFVWHGISLNLDASPELKLDNAPGSTLPPLVDDFSLEGHYIVQVGGSDEHTYGGCVQVELRNPDGSLAVIEPLQHGGITIDENNCEPVIAPDEFAVTFTSKEAGLNIPTGTTFRGLQLQFRLPNTPSDDSSERVLLSAGLETPNGDGHIKVGFRDAAFVEVSLPGASEPLTKLLPGNVEDGNWHTLILFAHPVPVSRKRRQTDDAVVEKDNLIESDLNTTPSALEESTATPTEEHSSQPDQASSASDDTVTTEAQTDSQSTSIETTPDTTITENISTESPLTELPEGAAESDNNRARLHSPPLIRSYLLVALDGYSVHATAEEHNVHLLKGNVRIGSLSTSHGFVGCIRNVTVDQAIGVDLRVLVADQHGVVSTGQCALPAGCEANPCKHGGRCTESGQAISCDCTNTGYAGRTCSLPALLESCAELYLAGERKSGVHRINVAGSGPAYVHCDMNASESKGTTVVSHNLPVLEMKNSSLGGARFKVQYRHMDATALSHLAAASEECHQSLTVRCRNAPLGLGSHTWFRSVHEGPNITSLDSGNGKNCDVDDTVDRVDEGYFTGQNVPIGSVHFKNRKVTGKGSLTLGPFQCSGKPGVKQAISFTSKTSYLNLPALQHAESFKFQFKTQQTHATLLHQGRSLRLALVESACVRLSMLIGGEEKTLTTCSLKPLNNGGWHFVKVDFGNREVILSIDQTHNYLSWDFGHDLAPFAGPLSLGSSGLDPEISASEPGIVGCMRGFFRGSQLVDISALADTDKSQAVARECVSSCKPNLCQNGAECFDMYGNYECICANPVAHSGKHCEENINTNPVTFANASAAYIFDNTVTDILNGTVLMSFRTHSPSGLLFYAHDHRNNFAQIHLQGGNQVVFSFNLARRIQRIAVTKDGLNDGKWHQLKLARTERSVSLEVDFDHRSTMDLTNGLELLIRYSTRPWLPADKALETVSPPRPNVPMVDFHNLFIGGVKRPEYASSIPGFYGCIRGVKIGSLLLDLAAPPPPAEDEEVAVNRERDPGVLDGCLAGCETSNPCENGGTCINRWGDSTTPADCQCDGTSYAGATCSEDVGASFDGSTKAQAQYALVGNMLSFTLANPIRVHFAFSTNEPLTAQKAVLFVQFSQRAAELLFSLTPEGTLRADVYAEGSLQNSLTLGGNLTNGQRHYVLWSNSPRNAEVRLQVDDDTKSSSLASALPSVFVSTVSLGGVGDSPREESIAQLESYHGCLSNVVIDSPLETSIVLEPLKFVLREKTSPSVRSSITGNLEEGKCAAFAAKVQNIAVPDDDRPVTDAVFPPWDTEPAVAEEFVVTEPAKPIEKEIPQRQSGNTGIIVGVVCGLFVLAVLIGVLVYMCRLRKGRRNTYEVVEKQQQNARNPENHTLLSPNDVADPETLVLKPSRQR